MALCMDRLSCNTLADVDMEWQDWAVAVIGVAVVAAMVYRIWRFFFCGDRSNCDGCTKECHHRKHRG